MSSTAVFNNFRLLHTARARHDVNALAKAKDQTAIALKADKAQLHVLVGSRDMNRLDVARL